MDSILNAPEFAGTLKTFRRDVLKRVINQKLQALRTGGASKTDISAQMVARDVAETMTALTRPLLGRVVNASGIVLHTNLGRSLLTKPAQVAVRVAAESYCPLEMDLVTGKRTRRDLTLEPLLLALTGAEAATVVNNNAAAVLLILHTFANSRDVITSRGELVEIGGSYRVPDVVAASGCRLKEVGTTNRTRISDYERVITKDTALILKTHPSNYKITGFTEEAELEALCSLGRKRRIPVVWDLGSGYFPPETGARLPEPDVLAAMKAGPDLTCFSGDKLLGGPQAGIIVGKAKAIAALRKSPLWRALRIDKFKVAALGATLVEHLKRGHAESEIILRELLCPRPEQQAAVAERLLARLKSARPDFSFQRGRHPVFYGGGSLPEEKVMTEAISIKAPSLSAVQLDARLRQGEPAVVGAHKGGVYWVNLLSLLPGDEDRIVERVAGL